MHSERTLLDVSYQFLTEKTRGCLQNIIVFRAEGQTITLASEVVGRKLIHPGEQTPFFE
ncbi:hypothetical protein GCM10028817_02850 [Spirosoma pomorum]